MSYRPLFLALSKDALEMLKQLLCTSALVCSSIAPHHSISNSPSKTGYLPSISTSPDLGEMEIVCAVPRIGFILPYKFDRIREINGCSIAFCFAASENNKMKESFRNAMAQMKWIAFDELSSGFSSFTARDDTFKVKDMMEQRQNKELSSLHHIKRKAGTAVII